MSSRPDPTDKSVPCFYCETPTRMVGTQRCDNCWELEQRMRGRPAIAAIILANVLLNQEMKAIRQPKTEVPHGA